MFKIFNCRYLALLLTWTKYYLQFLFAYFGKTPLFARLSWYDVFCYACQHTSTASPFLYCSKECLFENDATTPGLPVVVEDSIENQLPGEIFDADDQCFLAYGTEACTPVCTLFIYTLTHAHVQTHTCTHPHMHTCTMQAHTYPHIQTLKHPHQSL